MNYFSTSFWNHSTMSLKKKPKEDDHEALAGEEVVTGNFNNVIQSCVTLQRTR